MTTRTHDRAMFERDAVKELGAAIMWGQTCTSDEDAIDLAQHIYDQEYYIRGARSAEQRCQREAYRYENM